MKKLLKNILVQRVSDLLLSPLTFVAAIWYKYIRTADINRMPISESIFMKVGVLPVPDHYYEPLINPTKHLSLPLDKDRFLPGINWNTEEQLALLEKFDYNSELQLIPLDSKDAKSHQYYYNNHSYPAGDGAFLYNMIRHFKPQKIIEIGCGFSTSIAIQAETKNSEIESSYHCEHTCIEPYEMPWLEQLKVKVIRKKVENVSKEIFLQLEANDILFIDSSHIIRPQGDVLFEFLEILPVLKSGVIVHTHDIFSPKDYPREWIYDKHCLWNEQYLLESFLSFNKEFRIIGSLNYLKHNHRKDFDRKCPASNSNDEPGAFWLIRN